MKKVFLVGMIALLSLGACQQNDGSGEENSGVNKVTNVKFALVAGSITQDVSVRAYKTGYDRNGFNIYAFRQVPGSDPVQFIYNRSIDLSNMTYNAETGLLTGTDNLEIGTYKFLHTYGINQANLVIPQWTTATALNNDLTINYPGSGAINEVFLETEQNLASLPSYTLGDNGIVTVTGTLNRAVSRVDFLFIPATRNQDGGFTEMPYSGTVGSDVLGDKTISEIRLELTGVNNRMDFFGANTTTTPIDVNINLTNPDVEQTWDAITIGNADRTTVGTEGYRSYDHIVPEHIIKGGAHIFGTYLFPNNSSDKDTGLVLSITPTMGETRTIAINDEANKFLLERNKVTLIKVYVLNGNNVFSTTVDFEVEVVTDWEDAYEATGTISR